MDKRSIREFYINHWFNKRSLKALMEYKEIIVKTPYYKKIILYKGVMINPLQIRPSELSGVYEVPEDSEHGRTLDRYIRVLAERTEVEGLLVKILNYCETNSDFEYIVFNEKAELVTDLQKLDSFKESISSKLALLKRIRLMADMVK